VKWLPPNLPVQYSADRKYCIVRATETHWIAYELTPTTGIDLGNRATDERARRLCEEHEDDLKFLRKQA
jgi:hypothetical protein